MYSINPTSPASQETAESGVVFMASVTGAITSAWVWAFRAGQDRDRPCCRTWERLR